LGSTLRASRHAGLKACGFLQAFDWLGNGSHPTMSDVEPWARHNRNSPQSHFLLIYFEQSCMKRCWLETLVGWQHKQARGDGGKLGAPLKGLVSVHRPRRKLDVGFFSCPIIGLNKRPAISVEAVGCMQVRACQAVVWVASLRFWDLTAADSFQVRVPQKLVLVLVRGGNSGGGRLATAKSTPTPALSAFANDLLT
jgi:hypothetical protein